MKAALLTLLQDEIRRRALPDDFLNTVEQWYLPTARYIYQQQLKKQQCLLVSFNGAQGSGKSTITAFLRLLLQHQFGLNTVEISIDDFYLTRAERQQLAEQVHPLFITRGVPGTHDVELARRTIDCLQHCDDSNPCQLPSFDKAVDDRRDPASWPLVQEPVQVILFEGWCNHAPVQTEQELEPPVNDFERDEDRSAAWRRYANDQLKVYHQQLFDMADMLVYLQVPSFEKVYEWRGLQEQKLAQAANENKHAVMDQQQLARFIQHYERITRACLQQLPQSADLLLQLDEHHAIQALQVRQPEMANG
ncbi:MAG: hypothetical protein QNJ69_02840 [Gammaproteobacteria bacterium]|nr:hypothetical protein [Gammaproteobacteria bacterium]